MTNRLNVDAILIFDAYWAAAPPPSPACHMPANRSDCRYAIRGDRVPVAGTDALRY